MAKKKAATKSPTEETTQVVGSQANTATGPSSSEGVEPPREDEPAPGQIDAPAKAEEKKTPKSKRDALDEIDALKAKLSASLGLPTGELD